MNPQPNRSKICVQQRSGVLKSYRLPSMGRALVFLLLLSGSALAQTSQRRNVLVHASTQPDKNTGIWVAAAPLNPATRIPESKTRVFFREVLGDTKWLECPTIPARTAAITSHGGEMVLVIDDQERRSWAWFSANSDASRFSYGPLLPGGATLLALAGDYNSLFSLGAASSAHTTAAGSQPATAPATQPAGPVLFVLQGTAWKQLPAPWPAAAPRAEPMPLSLQIIGEQPWLAVVCPDESIRLYQLAKDASAWVLMKTLPVPPRFRHLKLLNRAGRPTLWLVTDAGPGALVVDDRTIALSLPPPVPSLADMDLTVAGDQLRLIFYRNAELYEQRYKLNGSEDGSAAQLAIAPRRGESPTSWLAMTVMTALAIFLVVSFLRRRPAPADRDRKDDDE
jgi:hypothetical protein